MKVFNRLPRELSAIDLNNWLTGDTKIKPILIDVRESWEYEIAKIEGAKLISMAHIPSQIDSLINDQPYVIFCHHGIRSMKISLFLSQNGFSQVFNLTGGIEQWRRQIDSSIPFY